MFGFGQAPTHTSDVQFGLAVSSDKQTFDLTFDNFEVAVRPGKSLAPMATRLFHLALPLEDGSTGVEIAFAIQGAVLTLEGATGTMVFSVNGQSIVADFPANSDKEYVQELKFKAATASECRLGVFLVAGRDSKNSNAEAYLNVTSINATIQPSTKKKS
jgi:hypothetical protein